jgi:hypothetical protein
MSKQTAVEWYEKEINSLIEKYEAKEILKREFIYMKHNLFYNAKEMEKEQIENTWIDATPRNIPKYEEITKEYAKQYYNETYKKAQ